MGFILLCSYTCHYDLYVNLTQKNQSMFNYAIIIPCYNEAFRLPYHTFQSFSLSHPEVLLLFVNDGSTDNTLSVLRGLQMKCPANVSIHHIKINVGKAEAVRQGIMYVYNCYNIPLIGFLDADLATNPEEWMFMAKYHDDHHQFAAIVGSRIQRLGANISRDNARSFFSKLISYLIQKLLSVNFQDTQCGAKIFQRELVPYLFGKKYISSWLFDIEILFRIQQKFGKNALQYGVLEYPLLDWHEIGDSRIKMKHMVRIPYHLYQIYLKYRY